MYVRRSVRAKFIFFTIALCIFTILFISIPVVISSFRPYRELIAQSLVDRTNILLDNIDLHIRDYLKDTSKYKGEFLIFQDMAFDDVIYIVVTGRSSFPDRSGIDYILFANTDELDSLIDTEVYSPGISRFCPAGMDKIVDKITHIEIQANKIVSDHVLAVQKLRQDDKRLLFQHHSEAQYKHDIQKTINQMEAQLQRKLAALVQQASGSFPAYTAESLTHNISKYLFYKPIISYDKSSHAVSVKGIMFAYMSIEDILVKLKSEYRTIIRSTIQVILAVLLFGILTSWALSTIFLKPIGALAAHAAMIQDTDDKETLTGKSVIIKSKDELGMLGQTINNMTEQIAAAAMLAKDLKFGQEIQKMFIPLELSPSGRKLTTGSHRDLYCEFFGYYEGAHGVSGDYFDYIKLDSYHYAVIKCDVAGKGIPAALIMVEVATLFQNYFKEWRYQVDGYNLSPIVMRINDIIESHGFVDRFAAFSLCVINMYSGDAYFCNAGDNIVTIYSNQEKQLHSYALHTASAAGAFTSKMVNLKGGFPVEKLHLNCGDILFLYTDGIEEAKRVISKVGEGSDNPSTTEEFGKKRVKEVIEAVFAHSRFTLRKVQGDSTYEEFDFDFSTCNGTMEEAIIALISVEKVFRMYTVPDAPLFDCIQVDKNIDSFLSKYFLQYTHYCKQKEPNPIYSEYYYYRNIKEDMQYDDLTVLAITRWGPVYDNKRLFSNRD